MYINPDPCSIKSVRKEILTYSLLRSPICSVLIAATIATGSALEAPKKPLSAKPDFGRNPTILMIASVLVDARMQNSTPRLLSIDVQNHTTFAYSCSHALKCAKVGKGLIDAACLAQSTRLLVGSFATSCSISVGFRRCCSAFADCKKAVRLLTRVA